MLRILKDTHRSIFLQLLFLFNCEGLTSKEIYLFTDMEIAVDICLGRLDKLALT